MQHSLSVKSKLVNFALQILPILNNFGECWGGIFLSITEKDSLKISEFVSSLCYSVNCCIYFETPLLNI